jgi:hypothetical protein
VVSVGPNASLTVNSGPIKGAILLGDGSSANSSGGGNGQITGGVFADTSALANSMNQLQIAPNTNVVSSSVTTQAFSDANSLASAAQDLAPNVTYSGTISQATTINAQGRLTVVHVGSIQNAPLTFQGDGSGNDNFVVVVSGTYNTNVTNTLTGGVTASNILFDFTGTSGNLFQTSGGDTVQGTFLATNGGDFQFSALNLQGQLINTGGHIQFVSNSSMGSSPFTPSVPEPGSLGLLAMGSALASCIAYRRITRRKGQFQTT